MRRAVLQPAGGGVAREHYRDTVDQPVSLNANRDLLGADLAALRRLHASGAAAMWGATPGKNDANLRSYRRMSPGDYVFFAGEGRLFAGATVTHTFRNSRLAEKLWGYDHKQQTWELMFALDELRRFDIPYAELNHVIGYQANNVVQGFTVLDNDRSAALFDYLTLDSDRHPAAAPGPDQLAELLAGLPPGAEEAVTTTRRLEQGLLRRTMLSSPVAKCQLCGDEYPVQFLVAAHVKKRSACSDHERLDIPAVAMIACKFGCDTLYEEGYIGVGPSGRIEVSALAPREGPAARYLELLSGRTCDAFSPQRADYFEWHRTHTFKAR